MNKKKIIQSVFMLLPAVVVGAACALGLALHPVDIVAPDTDAAVSQVSDEASEMTSVPESARPETVSEEQSASVEASDTSKTESGHTSSSKPTKKSSALSEKESSKTQEKPAQQSGQRAESSQSSKAESSRASDNSALQAQTSTQQESSRSAAQQTSSPKPRTETSRQESRQSSSKPAQESSTPPAEISQVSEETSYAPEVPAGRYIDGTYKATAEVDGFDEEGFLYDLEVTVTVSGGEITSITGKIKNDRSEDPSSNEAYVRRAVKKLSDVIIANQGADGVDVISNATYSSNAVLRAVSETLSQAER